MYLAPSTSPTEARVAPGSARARRAAVGLLTSSPGHAAERGDQIFGEAGAEIGVGGVAGLVREGDDGQGAAPGGGATAR